MKSVSAYFQDEDYERIKFACRVVGLSGSSFIKTLAVREANKIIREIKEGEAS